MSNRSVRVRKGHLLFAAGATVLAGLTVASAGAPLSASAQPAAPGGPVTRLAAARTGAPSGIAETSSSLPTVVLVHGAWADSSSWDGVIDRLRQAGYPVVAAADPLEGLAQDSAAVASLLRSIKGPVILAGHSYGGAVISSAAAGNPNVKALVYIAAFAPDKGESIVDLLARPVAHPIAGLPLVSYPVVNANGTTDTESVIDPAQFPQVFAGDLNPALAADMAASQRPAASGAVTEAAAQAAWQTIPSWYLVARQDHAIAPDLERFMAARAHAHTVEADGSHSVMVSHPDTVAQLIETAARSTR
jgi:pimeloyl-ACP methyl ester carboxylesterase